MAYDTSASNVIFNQGNKRRIRPATVWAGGAMSTAAHPRTFSYAAIRTMVRPSNFRERPASREASEAAGASRDLGTGW